MAEKQGKIKITASAELGALQEINSKLASMKEGFVSGATAANALGNIASAAVSKLSSALQGALGHTEKYLRATDDQIKSLQSLSQSVGGVIGPMELMRARTRMMTGELAIAERDLSNIGKAGVEIGRRLGEDATQGFERLSMAMQGGRGLNKMMRLLGEDIKFTGDATTDAQIALQRLDERFGSINISAKNAGERVTAFQSSVSLAWAEVLTAIKHTSLYKKVLDELGAAAGVAGAAIKWMQGKSIGPDDLMRALPPGLRERFAPVASTLKGAGAGMFGTDERPYVDEPILGSIPLSGSGKTGGRAGGGAALWKQNTAKAQAGLMSWIDRTLKGKEEREMGEFQRGSESRERADDLRRVQALRAEQEAAAEKQRALDAEDEKVRALVAIYATYDQQMRQMAVGSIAQFAGGLWNIVDAAIMGGDSVGAALAKMLKSTMLAIASEATVKAIMATAEGIFALASIVRAGQAPAYFAAAGKFAAVAAIAGGVGLGMSAAGVGAPSQRAGSNAGAGGNYRPSFGQRQNARDLPPIVVRVTFDRSDPASEQFARRRVRAQLEAAGYSEAA